MKRLSYIIGILSVLFACNNTNGYVIKGSLSNLEDKTLYVVLETPEKLVIDTIVCNEKGYFSMFYSQDNELQAVTIYYNDRDKQFAVFPELGTTLQIAGDANEPLLMEIKGGRLHQKLSQFTKKAAPMLKELSGFYNSGSLSSEETTRLTNLHHEMQLAVQDFVAKNPKEKASAILISKYYNHNLEEERTEDLLDMLSPELNDYFLVKNIRKTIEKAKTTQVGAKAPAFEVRNMNGQTITVDSFANKYCVLTFTALWCDICHTEAKKLDDMVEKYTGDSIEVLMISLDNELDDIRKMIRQDSIQWHVVSDSAGQAIHLFDIYNVKSLPKCFLIDRDGTILLNTTSGEEVKQKVDEIMHTPHNF